ncbi:hypothetical protein BGZ88_010579 [Linnemannia elongata]|uniref:NAD(P)-binding protein n=1 Tax=Linnemannia elongata AG-77 TaxID=1314771 RepID=A0A197JSG3_9FUNG|nr:hypothetical protein BGZ88_010579 [Linnemannia elongata]OAQ27903.1 NAD(P)-binding protein [Linnemannia elongata AG-77]
MAALRVFVLGATGYIGSTFLDLLLKKEDTARSYTFRALVRSQDKADQLIRPQGIEPVLGSLDDVAIIEDEAANADIVINLADADHLTSVQAIIRGLSQRPRWEEGRRRPILIHTSGTGVLLDGANGQFASETIYYDNDVAQLNTLEISQLHRVVDVEIINPALVGVIDTYIVAPPTIWGFGTGRGNNNSIQIPAQIANSLKHGQAMQIGKGLNIWSKVHVIDLAHFYISLLERAIQEPQDADEAYPLGYPLPKNEDAYYFVQEGDDFAYGDVAKEIAKVFQRIGINDSGAVNGTAPEEEAAYWPEGSNVLLGGNSRSRAVKAREILGWEPKYTDFVGYIDEEIHRQKDLLDGKKPQQHQHLEQKQQYQGGVGHHGHNPQQTNQDIAPKW